mgnify:CR=1 FL=1
MATHPPYVPRAGQGPAGLAGQRYRRNRRSELAMWWREIDRWLLAMVLVLVLFFCTLIKPLFVL